MKATQDSGELRRYAMSGMAAFLPGMQYMVELMQRQLDEFRLQLASMQGMEELRSQSNGHAPHSWAGMTAEERSEEMQRRVAKRKKKHRTGWEGMTAEERKAEMKRRKGLAEQTEVAAQAAPSHPRDKDHPGHAMWLARLRKAHRKAWAQKDQGRERRPDSQDDSGLESKAARNGIVMGRTTYDTIKQQTVAHVEDAVR
jgi:hypothetical protein